MSYVVDNLPAEEDLIYRASLHWIIFVSPLFWFALGLFGSAISLRLASDLAPLYGSIAILLFSVWKLFVAYIRLFTSEICLTSKRVIAKVGFIRRQCMELKLEQIETVGIDQSVSGRLLDYGTLRLAGTGGHPLLIADIASPLKLRNRVAAHIAGFT